MEGDGLKKLKAIGMPSLFPMRHDDLESHRADRLFSPCRPVAQSQVYCVSFACLVRADNCARSKVAKWGNVPVNGGTFRGNSYAENVREYAGTWNGAVKLKQLKAERSRSMAHLPSSNAF